ncbi:MAG: PAS domain S-box-containing protein, partial [Myxococcota bacterium]
MVMRLATALYIEAHDEPEASKTDSDMQDNSRPDRGGYSIVSNRKTAGLALLFGLAATLAVTYLSYHFVAGKTERVFDERTQEITEAIQTRMLLYEQVLWGGVGFLTANGGNLDRKMWHDYVAGLKLTDNWPGLQGMGVAIPVSPAEKEAHVESIRAEGFPEYTIKPSGRRDEYSAIVFLEPFDWRNKRAFGYDMWSNEMRRKAMTRARDTAEASTSGIITLVQETEKDVQRGFLTYVPVYNPRMPQATVEERRAAFLGWVYSPFRMGDLMNRTLGSLQAHVNYRIYDSGEQTEETLLFAKGSAPADSDSTLFGNMRSTKTVELQGRQWTLEFDAQRGRVRGAIGYLPWFVGCSGLVLSLLMFYIIRTLSQTSQRAEEIAAVKTIDLQESEALVKEALARAESLNLKLEFQSRYLNEHAIVSIAGVDGKFIYVNDKFCAASGYAREELVGKMYKHALISPPGGERAFFDDLQATLRAGKPFRGEIRNRRKDGGFFWAMATIVPFLDSDGQPLNFVSVRTDITHRKEAESDERQVARQEIERLRASLDLSEDQVYLFGVDSHKCIYMNDQAMLLSGWTESGYRAKTPLDAPHIFEANTFDDIGTSEGVATVYERHEKGHAPIEVQVQLIAPDGKEPHYACVVRDLSVRKETARTKAEFISTVSHELRTPLTSIRGALGLITGGAVGTVDPRMGSLLAIALKNSDRLTDLINDLLDLEKMAAGKMTLVRVPIEVGDLIVDAVESHRGYADTFGVRFEL